jgi:hypothetical protein
VACLMHPAAARVVPRRRCTQSAALLPRIAVLVGRGLEVSVHSHSSILCMGICVHVHGILAAPGILIVPLLACC